jgi:uncharacterized protein YbjT (DUF2867 family)
MATPYNRKPIPRSILIFGAGGHIGGTLARFLQREAPHVRLRLASSREEGCEAVRRDFPEVEVVNANYYDLPTLEVAVKGMEDVRQHHAAEGRAGRDDEPDRGRQEGGLRCPHHPWVSASSRRPTASHST